MKIKTDFVTNSSSCCYVISSTTRLTQKQFNQNGFRGRFNEFTCIGTRDELISYTQSKTVDWISRATGPIRFWNLTREEYEYAMEMIKQGFCISHIHVERDYDNVSDFDTAVVKIGCNVLSREYD